MGTSCNINSKTKGSVIYTVPLMIVSGLLPHETLQNSTCQFYNLSVVLVSDILSRSLFFALHLLAFALLASNLHSSEHRNQAGCVAVNLSQHILHIFFHIMGCLLCKMSCIIFIFVYYLFNKSMSYCRLVLYGPSEHCDITYECIIAGILVATFRG